MNNSSMGQLQVKTTSAGGALPAENINVRIRGNDEGNIGVDYSLVTGRDGLTDTVSLPAPDPTFSRSPNSAEQVFATYNVQAFGEGFYPKEIKEVAVFGTVKSLLTLNMIPDAGFTRDTPAPNSSNNSIITENEALN